MRGSSRARVDDKGRVKIPTIFRSYIEEKYGRECFVTSDTGDFVKVYPMPVWVEIEKKMMAQPSMHPAVARFRDYVNYYGQGATIDDQGRLLIHPDLRLSSGIDGDVRVIGSQTCLDIWNRERFEAKLKANPVSEEDRQILAT
ncbi:MAG TPA: division/cell wall cluster transcriptional repressor MraZ, partial [Candidatus Polarisedimenticolia bacterium]|nr:division/cell wall cluster transcriptional repressor MraZ [Candidatus Polarisedimenticolia bacterium]